MNAKPKTELNRCVFVQKRNSVNGASVLTMITFVMENGTKMAVANEWTSILEKINLSVSVIMDYNFPNYNLNGLHLPSVFLPRKFSHLLIFTFLLLVPKETIKGYCVSSNQEWEYSSVGQRSVR